jgi:hypothetical protein
MNTQDLFDHSPRFTVALALADRLGEEWFAFSDLDGFEGVGNFDHWFTVMEVHHGKGVNWMLNYASRPDAPDDGEYERAKALLTDIQAEALLAKKGL